MKKDIHEYVGDMIFELQKFLNENENNENLLEDEEWDEVFWDWLDESLGSA